MKLNSFRFLNLSKVSPLEIDGKLTLSCVRARIPKSPIPTTTYKLAAPKYYSFWPAFVTTRILTPRSQKSGYGLLLGCRSPLDFGPLFDFFLLTKFEPQNWENLHSLLVHGRNRSGVVELVGREPLIIARVENGVTKFSPQRQKAPKFSKHSLDQENSFQWGFWPREN